MRYFFIALMDTLVAFLEKPPGLSRRQWDQVRPLLVIALLLLSMGLVVKWLRGW